jgi:hypothetical protein
LLIERVACAGTLNTLHPLVIGNDPAGARICDVLRSPYLLRLTGQTTLRQGGMIINNLHVGTRLSPLAFCSGLFRGGKRKVLLPRAAR